MPTTPTHLLVPLLVPLLAPLLTPGLAAAPTALAPAPPHAPAGPHRIVAPTLPAGPATPLPAAGSASRLAEMPPPGVWPLAPAPPVLRGFDPPTSPYGAGHRGVDLRGVPGQPVRAAASGRVTYAGMLAGRGVVVVDHGATRTTYEPVDAQVVPGSVVEAGDRLGTLQQAGGHCAPAACLHWGLVEGDTYLDPLSLVGVGPVRLVPLTGLGRR